MNNKEKKMDKNTKTTFEGWAIVELFGHNQIAGHITDAAQFGTSMMRVDVPELVSNKPFVFITQVR